MIVHASGQSWKLMPPVGVIGFAFGLAMWWGFGGLVSFMLASMAAGPVIGWSWYSIRCPRCRDPWYWTQAVSGKTPSLQPVNDVAACPKCGLTAAEMTAARVVAVRVCDTRRGDDLSRIVAGAQDRPAATSEPIVMVDATAFDWAPHAAALDAILRTDAGYPFVICNPWWPGVEGTKATIVAALPGATNVGPAFLAARAPGPFVADILRLRARVGGPASGTWIVGTCVSLEALSAELRARTAPVSPVLFAALDLLPSLTGALCLDELQTSTLVVRVTPENAAAVDRLLERAVPGPRA